MAGAASPILVSWIAVNNDPYERNRDRTFALVEGKPVPGPTLTLLLDPQSPYCGRITEAVFFARDAAPGAQSRDQEALEQTIAAVRSHLPTFQARVEKWKGEDPTDHKAIFAFMRPAMSRIRQEFRGRSLILHLSPGTPSMHTIWVLMAETGLIELPFSLVKSYRPAERRSSSAVAPVEVGIETFLKVYQATASQVAERDDQAVFLDPRQFSSRLLKDVYEEARRFANLRVPVLILGERGTGKTSLASWIRSTGPYRKQQLDLSWPTVACGQYTTETMRAELFGYRKGAFTGADRDRDGLLAALDGDTLFLDEIGDISPDLQRLLIKAVEEHTYLPIGDSVQRKSVFRLVAATNLTRSDLAQRLHPDFLDRVSQVVISVPPLRCIPEDLTWIWESVYHTAAARSGASSAATKAISASSNRRVVEELRRHPLPGNYRDLYRVAYRIIAAATDPLEPMTWDEAVQYGLDALKPTDGFSSDESQSRNLARRFADLSPLEDLVSVEAPLRWKAIETEFKRYAARELRRISAERGVRVEQLCDVSERSIRLWATGDKFDR